jgi:chromosome segregation ATPase
MSGVCSDCRTERDSCKTERDLLNVDKTVSSETIEALEENAAELEENIVEHKRTAAHSARTVSKLKKSNESLKSELEKLQRRHSTCEDIINRLKEQIGNHVRRIAVLETSNEKLNKTNSILDIGQEECSASLAEYADRDAMSQDEIVECKGRETTCLSKLQECGQCVADRQKQTMVSAPQSV